MRTGRKRSERGFTLVELIVVVAIIGILVTVAMPIYKDSVQRSREAVLKEDLWIMRDAIDQYFTDRGRYPSDLGALVDAKYIKAIPVDPMTGAADTWVPEDADSDEALNPDEPAGIRDVHSGAPGNTADGTPYSEL